MAGQAGRRASEVDGACGGGGLGGAGCFEQTAGQKRQLGLQLLRAVAPLFFFLLCLRLLLKGEERTVPLRLSPPAASDHHRVRTGACMHADVS